MSERCRWLHERLQGLPLIRFPFDAAELPESEVEKGTGWFRTTLIKWISRFVSLSFSLPTGTPSAAANAGAQQGQRDSRRVWQRFSADRGRKKREGRPLQI